MLKLRSILVTTMVAVLLAGATFAIGQSDDWFRSYRVLVRQLRALKRADITPESAGPLVSQVLIGLEGNEDGRAKRCLLRIGLNKINLLNGVIGAPDGNMLKLLYYSRRGVPTNLTDAGLKKIVGSTGQTLHNRIAARWSGKKITPEILQALEGYGPIEAALLAHAVAMPEFTYAGDLPVGASHTTDASSSLFEVVRAINLVEFTKRSTVAKLLGTNGFLGIPLFTQANFDWSHRPSVRIDLSFERWTEADVPDLQRLVSNPIYREMAEAQLYVLGH